jgi:hypothetical protein
MTRSINALKGSVLSLECRKISRHRASLMRDLLPHGLRDASCLKQQFHTIE